jgi:hypothetical protein
MCWHGDNRRTMVGTALNPAGHCLTTGLLRAHPVERASQFGVLVRNRKVTACTRAFVAAKPAQSSRKLVTVQYEAHL